MRLTNALATVDVLEHTLVTVQSGGAVLAWVTPGTSHGGTAQLLGAHHALQLTLTHVVPDSREARSRAVICNTARQLALYLDIL